MNIIENNKIIAEFVQPSFNGFGTYDFNGGFYGKLELKFHSDWNWLMEVVEKIEDYNYGATLFIIEDERCHVNTQNGFEVDSVGHTKIESTYNACVEFIKWYNEQKN